MNELYDTLFTPWQVGSVTIPNRIVLSPMAGTSLFGWLGPSRFDREAASFLLERARAGAGLIIPGAAPLRDPIGNRWIYKNKKMFAELRVFMEHIHDAGAKLFLQLTAGYGRSFPLTKPLTVVQNNPVLSLAARPFFDVRALSAAPGDLPSRWADTVHCRPMKLKEIAELIHAFARTAALCREAGVDGVEVHALHAGCLIDSFTLPYTNPREDSYGGEFENRYRFPAEIVGAIKNLCGDDFPVSLRYAVTSKTKGHGRGAVPGEDFEEAGRTAEESERAAKYLAEAGYDMLNCDNGSCDAWYWAHPPQYMPEACNLEDVARLRAAVDIPVVCAGKMTPAVGAKAIAEGKIDAMGVARQFLADGLWVKKLLEDKEDTIRPCICCHNGCLNAAHWRGQANVQDLSDALHPARCALDPTVMQRKKHKIQPALRPKRIAVVGGGIAGMEAALVLSKRGHAVTIYEKSDRLGGVYHLAAAPDFKQRDRALIRWYCGAIARSNIDVRFCSEVTDVKQLYADDIIIATGAKPRRLPVRGAERAIDAIDYLGGAEVGENIVIVGGGLTGCEVAYDLCRKGKHPVIVEMKNDLMAQKGISLANSSFLRDYFEYVKLPILLNTKLSEVTEEGVLVRTKEGVPIDIPADTVILACGYRPNPLKHDGSMNIHHVGGCREAGNLRTAIWSAWEVCMRI
ncbi:MAG: FAD-dependent oxidoreductase [Clostridia bacterium]|nr:FAD-dependent oxidoreductase [Clostridia bacterium]